MQENLPIGWTTVRIGDIVTFEYGKSLTKNKRQDGNVPVYGSNGIVGKHSQSLTSEPCLIIGRKGSVGAIHVSKVPCWAIDTTYYVEPPPEIDLLYLFYLLKTKNLASLDRSTTIPGLSRNDVYSLEIPISPLNEQYRIVAKIEELVARLNLTRERLDKVLGVLKAFRERVLAEAYSGGLTNAWRQENPNYCVSPFFFNTVKEEDKKHLKNKSKEPSFVMRAYSKDGSTTVDANPSLPNNWLWAAAGRVCSSVRDGTHDTPVYVSDGVPLITSKNLKKSGLDFSTAKHISWADHQKISVRSGVEEGDVLFAMIGTIGNPVVVQTSRLFSIKNVGLFKKNETIISSKFLKFWLESPLFNTLLKEKEFIKGTTQPFIPLQNLRLLPVPLPPLAEQHYIVTKIEALLALADHIEERLAAEKKQDGQLTQAILAKAFRGELVHTEAELAKREGRSFEPASVLLERIKRSKATKF